MFPVFAYPDVNARGFWENSRQLCKPSTLSWVCITVSNSPNPSCVYIRLRKHGKCFLLLINFSSVTDRKKYLGIMNVLSISHELLTLPSSVPLTNSNLIIIIIIKGLSALADKIMWIVFETSKPTIQYNYCVVTIFALKIKFICTGNFLQPNPINMDTERAMESAYISKLSILSRSCF